MKKIALFATLALFGIIAGCSKEQPIPEGLEYEIVDGKTVTITGYDDSTVTLYIPERIKNLPVTSVGDGAFNECYGLQEVTMFSTVTSVGDRVFIHCISLTNIDVDDRNSAYTSIDGVLFDKNIQTIIAYPAGKKESSYDIPSSVTSIANGAFFGGSSLVSITIPSLVTSIGEWAFSGSRSLTSVIIPSSVMFMGEFAFVSCNNLTSINVDNNNSVYASIDGILFDKDIQTIIAYPAGKPESSYAIPSSVTSIGDAAFAYCSSLTGITIPSSVTSIGEGAFYRCDNLTNVTLSRSTQVGESAFPESARITYRD